MTAEPDEEVSKVESPEQQPKTTVVERVNNLLKGDVERPGMKKDADNVLLARPTVRSFLLLPAT